MSKKTSKATEKINFDVNNDNLVLQLSKHMNDWFEDHRHEEFTTPKQFQNLYPQWDKYESKSFCNPFYSLKKKIKEGE